MKILVAGGSGFIGSHLVETLLEQGHQVHAIDNLITGLKKNIEHLKDNQNFQFFEGDICKTTDLPKESYDRIYNLASPASPVDFKKIPLSILEVGSTGHKNLLEMASSCKARILFASTSEVYGDPLVNPQKEEYFGNVNCIGERSCYDEAKRFGEALTVSYQKFKSVETRTIRIFNTFGPRMRPDDGRVIPNFFIQSLKGNSLTIYGDGKQTRSLCPVSDMVNGMITLMESDVKIPVNIGHTEELTILQIADKINAMTGNKADHTFFELPENDPKVRQPDITRATELLGWKAQSSVDDYLNKSMEFFKQFV